MTSLQSTQVASQQVSLPAMKSYFVDSIKDCMLSAELVRESSFEARKKGQVKQHAVCETQEKIATQDEEERLSVISANYKLYV